MTDEKDDIKLASADKALLKAAATGEGLVEVTPGLLDNLRQSLNERRREYDEDLPKLVEACDPATRLAVTAWVIKHIVAHAREGGTYRYLIYDRLGFGPEAYVPLYLAGGMEISNNFELPKGPTDSDDPTMT